MRDCDAEPAGDPQEKSLDMVLVHDNDPFGFMAGSWSEGCAAVAETVGSELLIFTYEYSAGALLSGLAGRFRFRGAPCQLCGATVTPPQLRVSPMPSVSASACSLPPWASLPGTLGMKR